MVYLKQKQKVVYSEMCGLHGLGKMDVIWHMRTQILKCEKIYNY